MWVFLDIGGQFWMMDLLLGSAFSSCTKPWNKWYYYFDPRKRQPKCAQKNSDSRKKTNPRNSSNMASSWCKISPTIIPSLLVFFLIVSSSVSQSHASSESSDFHATNQTLRPEKELQKLKFIKSRLRKINKPAVKTIQA